MNGLMNVVKFHKAKNCMASNNAVDVLFDGEIDRQFIEFIAEEGKMTLYENFPKPFFVIEIKKKYLIKGALGNDNARMYLPEKNCDKILEDFRFFVEEFVPVEIVEDETVTVQVEMCIPMDAEVNL